MSELQIRLVQGAFRVMQSRQFVRLLQDRRVLSVLVDGMSLRARSRAWLQDLGTGVARSLGLATLDDLRDLERQLKTAQDPAAAQIDRYSKRN